MLFEIGPSVVPALSNPLTADRKPRAALLNQSGVDSEIDHLARKADALAIHDVELHLAERRCKLVLHHFDARAVTRDGHVALGVVLLEGSNAADIQALGRVELQRVASGRGFRTPEHHTYLHSD